jgi:hypothetical protein
VIGRALVLSKLEEAAMLRAIRSEESFTSTKRSYLDATGAFNKRLATLTSYISGGVIYVTLNRNYGRH